jgi:integrase
LAHKFRFAPNCKRKYLVAQRCKKPLCCSRFLHFPIALLRIEPLASVPAGYAKTPIGDNMKVRLSDRFCSNVKSTSRMEYFDEDTTGLALRVTETGSKSWTFNYTLNDKRNRLTLGAYPILSLAGARTKAIEARTALATGADPRLTAVGNETLQAVCNSYQAREGNKLRTAKWRSDVLTRLVYPVLGARPIRDIRRSEIVRLLDNIEDNNGPVMADRTLAIIQRVMNWHAGRADDFNSPVVRGMARTSAKELARKRILTDDELRAVWKTAETFGVFGDLVRFILLTATRRNEAAHMSRKELKGTDWIIPAERYKTKIAHLVPLSSAALALLPQSGEWMFPTSSNQPITAWSFLRRRFDKASGVTGYTIHDLRRSSRTLLSRAGVISDHAERCLGHVLPTIRGTYDLHSYRDEKLRAFEVLASLIDRVVHPQDNVLPLRAAQ